MDWPLELRISERQFKTQVPVLEHGYRPEQDHAVMEVADRAAARGYLLRDEFLAIVRWKSSRPIRRAERNSAADVEEATALAFSNSTSERLRIGALTLLDGVGYPVASVFLHLCHRDVYPILDFRALWTLGYDEPPSYTLGLWLAYTSSFRELCSKLGCGSRTLDRALWQYSNVNQAS